MFVWKHWPVSYISQKVLVQDIKPGLIVLAWIVGPGAEEQNNKKQYKTKINIFFSNLSGLKWILKWQDYKELLFAAFNPHVWHHIPAKYPEECTKNIHNSTFLFSTDWTQHVIQTHYLRPSIHSCQKMELALCFMGAFVNGGNTYFTLRDI